MARKSSTLPAPLVSVSLLFERSQVAELDDMAASVGLDRGRLVRVALGLLAAVGPHVLVVVGAAVRAGRPFRVRVEVD